MWLLFVILRAGNLVGAEFGRRHCSSESLFPKLRTALMRFASSSWVSLVSSPLGATQHPNVFFMTSKHLVWNQEVYHLNSRIIQECDLTWLSLGFDNTSLIWFNLIKWSFCVLSGTILSWFAWINIIVNLKQAPIINTLIKSLRYI